MDAEDDATDDADADDNDDDDALFTSFRPSTSLKLCFFICVMGTILLGQYCSHHGAVDKTYGDSLQQMPSPWHFLTQVEHLH